MLRGHRLISATRRNWKTRSGTETARVHLSFRGTGPVSIIVVEPRI